MNKLQEAINKFSENFDYESIKAYLTENDIEGIVFHDGSGQGRMCKIRKKDFGIKRNKI